MPTPNKDNIRKWVQALKSGRFEQARGVLRDGHRYCCLGVACELFRESVGGHWETSPAGDSTGFRFVASPPDPTASRWPPNNHYSDFILPRPVADWLGTDTNPEVSNGQNVGYNNDQLAASLADIATLIEDKFLREDADGAQQG